MRFDSFGRSGLKANFAEIVKHDEYINEESKFGTHQGVKGLEFNSCYGYYR